MSEKSEKYVASIDQGTTGTRFMVFNKSGEAIASAYREHTQIFPKPGWVEHDPAEIWENTYIVIKEVFEKTGVSSGNIAALGITNQRETAVLWDKSTGKPLCNAVVWQDTRTMDICRRLQDEGVESEVKKKSGLVVSTYFSGPKITWLLENNPDIHDKVKQGNVLFGNIDSWLIWNLTGGINGGSHVTDYTNASRTMLMDLASLGWDDNLLRMMNIPSAILPEIRPSCDKNYYGFTSKNGPFGTEIPVCGDLGDQQGALFGQTCFDEGNIKNTYGTGCFLLSNTGTRPVVSNFGLLTTVAYGLEAGKAVYALEGSIAITGAAVQWLRDNLKIIKDASESEAAARSVDDAGGMYFVPAFSGLFAPYWDMNARGVMVGLTRYITREHIVRATLESICYQTMDVIEAMKADTGKELSSLKVDGGATKNNFLMQFQADILGVSCIRPKVQETTALGSAYCAGLAVGFWEDLDDLKKNWQVDAEFNPAIEAELRQELSKGWKKAVERTRGWIS